MLTYRGIAGGYCRLLCLCLFLSSCATYTAKLPAEWSQLDSVKLSQTPFFPQKAYQCGPASLASILQTSGVQVTPDQLTEQVYLPGRQGSLQLDMVGATRRNGRIPYRLPPNLTAIRNELKQQRPVLVLQNLGFRSLPRMHYAVVVGMTPSENEITLHSGTHKNLATHAKKFLRSWDLADRWAIVSLQPGKLPADNDPIRFIKAVADYAAITQDTGAIESYASAVKRWPQNHLVWFSYAAAVQASGETQNAIQYYRRSLKINPDYLPSRNNLALLYAKNSNFTEALELLDTGNVMHPAGKLTSELEATRNKIIETMKSKQH